MEKDSNEIKCSKQPSPGKIGEHLAGNLEKIHEECDHSGAYTTKINNKITIPLLERFKLPQNRSQHNLMAFLNKAMDSTTNQHKFPSPNDPKQKFDMFLKQMFVKLNQRSREERQKKYMNDLVEYLRNKQEEHMEEWKSIATDMHDLV